MRIDLSAPSMPELDRSTKVSNGAAADGMVRKVPPNAIRPQPLATDEAHLSNGAKALSALKTQLDGVPALREQKIVELQKAIAGGTYHVSPQRIAEALLTDAAHRLG